MRDGIVVRCHFANINEHKYGVGNQPGKYVTNYAARAKATEPLSPLESQQQIAQIRSMEHKYAQRGLTTKQALYKGEWPSYLYRKLRRSDTWNGRTFGNLSLSYRKSTLQQQAKKIQKVYDMGHSANESIITFTIPYLKKMGVINPRFLRAGRGSLFGHVDQLKLRKAITNGINDATRVGKYQNPLWIAAIQLDTLHPHCHLVLEDDVPLSESKRLVPRRYQDKNIPYHLEDRGKLNSKERNAMANGIHSSLESSLSLHEYQAQPVLQRDNILSHVDDLVAYQALTNSRLQEVLASLPANQHEWSMDSKSPEMRHSNRLMNRYLDNMLTEYGDQIGYPATIDHFSRYSYLYQNHYHINDHQRQQIYQQQVTHYRHHLGNIAYRQLGTLMHYHTLSNQTGFLKASGESIPELQNEIARSYQGERVPHVQADLFVYRLNSYPHRYRNHINNMKRYHKASLIYDRQDRKMLTSPQSQVMQDYYRSEFMYHARLTDKYRYMIDRSHDDSQSVRKMNLQKDILDRQKMDLNELVSQPSLDVTPHEIKLLKQFRNDSKNSSLMNLPVNQQRTTLKSALGDMINDKSVQMSDDMQYNLIQFCKQTSQYNALANVFKRTNRIQNDNLTSNMVANYADDYNRYTYRGLLNGTLNHQQYRTPAQIYNSAMNNGHILTVPQAHSRKYQLKPRVFNDVKSDDMADTIYDLSPNASRQVDDDESAKYEQEMNHRYERARRAQDYLQSTQQSSQQLAELLRHIRLKRRIAEDIRRHKRLPIILHRQYIRAQKRENRLERSIDARNAYHYSQVNVSEWHRQSMLENQNINNQAQELSTTDTGPEK